MRRQIEIWGLVLSAILLPGRAAALPGEEAAEDDQRARELYENGRILFEEGLYEDAIAAWEAAWELSERPLLLYNIASAQERLGQWAEAMETLNRYRAYASAGERATLDRRIQNLEARLAERQQGTAAPASTAATGVAEEDSAHRRWSIAMMGAGAASLGAGTWLAFRAEAARNEALGFCVGSAPYTCSAAAGDALRRERLSAGLADGAYVLGAVGVIGGLVTWDRPGAQLGAGAGVLTLRGSF